MKKLLITGGAGFIGTHLTRALHVVGTYQVTVLDCLSPQVHGIEAQFSREMESMARCIQGDVTKPEDCRAALEGQEIVVHLAAETGTGQSMYEMARHMRTNVLGTSVLLEECLRERVERFLLTSSRAVYGEGSWRCARCGPVHPPIRERGEDAAASWDPRCPQCGTAMSECLPTGERETLVPTSVYGVSKVAQEQLVSLAGKTSPIKCNVLRFFNVFGPGQALNNPYTGVLGVFVNRARVGKPLDLYEDGEIIRDFVYVEDVVGSMLVALTSDYSGPINIGSGQGVTISQLAASILRLTGSDSTLSVTGKMRVGDVRGLVADLSLAKRALQWGPAWKFEDGLRLYVEWALRSPCQDLYESSMQELLRRGLYR